MSLDGPAFYDDDTVFRTYTQHRQRPENPNDTLEQPCIRELLGPLVGQRILDLGCGSANFGLEVLAQGAEQYVGIDGSSNMVAVARETLQGTRGHIIHAPIETWQYPADAFDIVVARLVLHYIADVGNLCGHIYQSLVNGGRFVFSVEHPVITSCDRGWHAGTARQDWLVDNYFETGVRTTTWLGGEVRKYHRTIEDYFGILQQTGFVVQGLREARPVRANFITNGEYERRKRIPLFLMLVGGKPRGEDQAEQIA
ncbi:MAG: methyltransferase domain-containing protein [Herpetosiphonaceae bacterium]|nr:methyltransferase domain-containing protein [Herpetosiphonaceae bacterium]